jgi:alpha-tubulin suppressor-like RCC1 family protein
MRRLGSVALLLLACTSTVEVLTSPDAGTPDAGLDAGVADPGQVSQAFSLTAGDAHACAVRGGALWCWGKNSDGQLGLGTTADGLSPARVGADADWVELSAGEMHTCGRRLDGSVWCWGGNGAGQLGQFDTLTHTMPAKVELPGPATQVETKGSFTCARLDDGALWCWGANFEGQLGLGDSFPGVDQLSAKQVVTDAGWLTVGTGQGHACGIHADGSLWCWGRNTEFQLGLGDDAGIQWRTPQRVGTDADWEQVDVNQAFSCALKRDHSLWCWGEVPQAGANVPVPTPLGAGTTWARVRTNCFHLCALSSSGVASCAGRNDEGQLGLGDTVSRPLTVEPDGPVSDLTAGRFISCERRANGTHWCTGANESGALGVGDTVRRNVWTLLNF